MTDTPYTGETPIAPALAILCGIQATNTKQTAKLMGAAKDALGIDRKAKNLSANDRVAIYRWHCDRLREADGTAASEPPVETISQPAQEETVEIASQAGQGRAVELFAQGVQGECVDIISQPDSKPVEALPQTEPPSPVEIISHGETVELYSQPTIGDSVNIFSQAINNENVEIISQIVHDDAVETFSQHGINDLVRIAFYTTDNGVKKRQVIALDGFYINALMQAASIGKADVPKWVQYAVDNWPAFDPRLPITKQVKCLIVRELTRAIQR